MPQGVSPMQEQAEQESKRENNSVVPAYKTFKYDNGEWENLPVVIPKFLFHLENATKHLNGATIEILNRETT